MSIRLLRRSKRSRGRSAPANGGGGGKATITPDDFTFVGGFTYQKRDLTDNTPPAVERCGLRTEPVEGQPMQRTMYFGDWWNQQSFTVAVDLENLSSSTDPLYWPKFSATELATGLREDDWNPMDTSRPNGSAILYSGRTFYWTVEGQWFLKWDDGTKIVAGNDLTRQASGGGFIDIPQWFADAHLGGRTFGFGAGGYQSGQGSSCGPTLAVADTPSDYDTALTNVTKILEFGFGGSQPERHEKRFSDYTDGLFGPDPSGSDGWWCTGRVGGGTWIDTDTKTGLCYFCTQGTGDAHDYARQDYVFSATSKQRVYIYSPDSLVPVIEGSQDVWEPRASYYEWEPPWGWADTEKNWPCGAHWDGEYLFVGYDRASNETYDPPPAIAVYSVSG